MLNEWSDRDPDPPSPWRDALFIGTCILTCLALVASVARGLGLL